MTSLSTLGLSFGASGVLDLRQFIDQNAPVYSTEKEAGYRNSLKKSRAESAFDENKQSIFVPSDEERLSRMHSEVDVMQFEDAINFEDDKAWDSVPRSHRRGRFAQYRQLAKAKLAASNAQQQVDNSRGVDGVQTRSDRQAVLQLKSRFNQFKAQWDEERLGLERAVREAERETEDAKRRAELAVRKLEELYERFKQTQNLSNADSNELQTNIGQLQVDKAQLETRVEELDHEVRLLNQLIKQAAKDKEDAERRLAASSSNQDIAAKPKTEDDDDLFADIDQTANGGDIPFPEDTMTYDGGPGLHLADHPIVGEFMRTYNHIMKSKTRLSELLSENAAFKEVASNLASMGEVGLQLDRDSGITPQVEDLGRNLTFVSDQIFLLVENVILTLEKQKRQPAGGVSKEKHEQLMKQIEDLKTKYASLGRMLEEKEQKFQSEQAERDSEIQSLQQSVAQLHAEVGRLRAEQQVDLQNSLMFTKLDAERNAKTLKRALASRRIGEAAYETALEAMEEYSSVPSRRLLAMSQRLLRGQAMERLHASILAAESDSDLSSERARQLLARLEEFEGRAGRRYDAIMSHLQEERLRLARGLVDTFQDVGESCSIFLIKPVLSLKHRENLEQHLLWVMDRNRRLDAERSAEEELSSRRRAQLDGGPRSHRRLSPCPEEASDRLPDISGSGFKRNSSLAEVWNINSSTDMRVLPPGFDRSLLNTPRLLEMDVNKILLGQNRITASLDAGKDGGGNLRYYVPLKRRSFDNFSTAVQEHGGPPPTTPAPGKQSSASATAGAGGGSAGVNNPPLPPIKAKTQS